MPILGFLKKVFGSESSDTESKPQTRRASSKTSGGPDVEEFVNFVVCSLVDDPDSVNIQTSEENGNEKLQISCQKTDVGKIIGRNGKTIAAIRALASGAGGRLGKKVFVEVLD